MRVVVTGAAGFIGSHVAMALLERGDEVLGIDNLNDYYDVSLKNARLARLSERPAFTFVRADVSDRDSMASVLGGVPADAIVHLAAQAGVRHSLVDPYVYVDANVMGQVVMLEQARRMPGLRCFVYASTSSVYGANTDLPFSVHQRVDQPISLYAATKRAGELIAQVYSHLYRIPATGLRFFTVYGPWGRPDMAAYLFAEAIASGRPISVFNGGDMQRDFTYVDDIVAGVLAAIDRPPADGGDVPHRIYNLGNHRSEHLLDFIGEIERAMGRKAELKFEPIQPGDVRATFADIESSRRELGFEPTTPISVGVPRFIEWFKSYKGMT